MYVYMIGAFSPTKLVSIKVGVTKDYANRIKQIQTSQPLEVRLIAAWKAKSRLHAFDVESGVHRKFGKQRLHGEWYRCYMIRDLRKHLTKVLGAEPCAEGKNGGKIRTQERNIPPTIQADLRVMAWMRENGFMDQSV